jgi:putative ABC transport system substrate-binding protein
MRRREFIAGLGSTAAWPLAASAQRGDRVRRIGVLNPNDGDDPASKTRAQQSRPLRLGIVAATPRTGVLWVAFERHLRQLGYVDGQNLKVEFIQVNLQDDTIRAAVARQVSSDVDIIVTGGNEFIAKAAWTATKVIPIVIAAVDYDPLALGYIANIARPGGNITGLFAEQIELASKRLQLMKEVVPKDRKMIVFWDRASAGQWQAAQKTSKALELELAGIELRDEPYDYEGALGMAPVDHRGAMLAMSSPIFFNDSKRLAEFTLRRGLPAMFPSREFVDLGALLSYGPNLVALFERQADYVDRLAKGAKPADVPVEQPTKFELIFNLKTARALGLDVPTSLLLRANEVIE